MTSTDPPPRTGMSGTRRSRTAPRPGRGRRRWSVSGLSAADRLRVVEVVLGVMAVALAAASVGAFYDGSSWLPWLAGTAVATGGATAGCVLTARRWWTTAAMVAGLGLVLAHTAGYRSLAWFGLPTPGSARSFGSGLATGLPKMLAVGLPADFSGDLVVLPVLLVGTAAAATVAVLLVTRRVTPAALPALVLFVLGLTLTASRGQDQLVLTGALVLVLLALLLMRSNRLSVAVEEGIDASDADAVGLDLAARRRRSTYGRVALGLPVVVLVAALALAGGWLLPLADGDERRDFRNLYRPPFRVDAVLSPLTEVRRQLVDPVDRPLFTVDVRTDDVPLDRVRVAALDTFTGALWTRSRTFQVTGTTLPDLEPIPGATEVRMEVRVAELAQPFLPVVGEPVRFDAADFAFDRATGTVVTTRGSATDLRYLTSGLVRPLEPDAVAVTRSRTEADRAYRALPEAPPWVRTRLEQITAGREEGEKVDLAGLLAIEAFLHNQSYSRAAPPGHSYGAIYQSLLGPEQREANSEQLASAFAVLARAAGYPVRVAVGYLLRPEEEQHGVHQVSTHDAHAWPEVHLSGYGWVPFEPTDLEGEVEAPLRNDAVTLASVDVAGPPAPGAATGGDAATRQETTLLARAGAVAGLVGGGIVLLVGGVVLAKELRRRWRAGHGSPAERVVGAWREVVDRLAEVGVRVPASRTAAEVVRDLRGGSAAPVSRHVAELAPVVAGAVFGFDEPDEAAVRRAWALERQVRRELASAVSLAVRLRGLVDPRPLVPQRRRGPVRAARARRSAGRTRAGVG